MGAHKPLFMKTCVQLICCGVVEIKQNSEHRSEKRYGFWRFIPIRGNGRKKFFRLRVICITPSFSRDRFDYSVFSYCHRNRNRYLFVRNYFSRKFSPQIIKFNARNEARYEVVYFCRNHAQLCGTTSSTSCFLKGLRRRESGEILISFQIAFMQILERENNNYHYLSDAKFTSFASGRATRSSQHAPRVYGKTRQSAISMGEGSFLFFRHSRSMSAKFKLTRLC